jgi:MOSC domain-containing protein YiiM
MKFNRSPEPVEACPERLPCRQPKGALSGWACFDKLSTTVLVWQIGLMITSQVNALLVGKPAPFRSDGATSTIGARLPAQGPVQLGYLGFAGDSVADPSVHGGPDKAVHFYPTEHYAQWRADIAKAGLDPHPQLDRLGGFGENISAEGMLEDRVHIGDRFRIGSALVEISQGRQPCWKIDHHFGLKGMTAGVIRTGRSGYYFRVIEEGAVTMGDAIEQVERATHGWTVEQAFQMLIAGMHRMDGAAAALRELVEMEALATSWRARAAQLLG